ncbi:MAG: FtsX-like permease family protein [Ginsengibacter sp.]
MSGAAYLVFYQETNIKRMINNYFKTAWRSENDTTYDVAVNETMIHKPGIQDPQKAVGKHIILNGNWLSTISGVVQDFQSESKHKKVKPDVLLYRPDIFRMASVKFQPSNMKKTIAGIYKLWPGLFPQRTKEVVIRKVFGATLSEITFLFSKEFVLLIAVAFVLAAPIAYYIMHNWLQSFAYQVTIGPNIFLIAILSSFVIAACTIAYQAIKAGVANPVKSLRAE